MTDRQEQEGAPAPGQGWAAMERWVLDGAAEGRPLAGLLAEVGRAVERERVDLRQVTETVPYAIARFDATDFRHLFVNAASAAMSGLTPERCVGRTMAEMGVERAHAEPWESRIAEVARTGQPMALSYPVDVADGTRWYDAELLPERDGAGRVASVLVISHDVTAERRVTRELQDTMRLLSQAEALAGVGSWIFDPETGVSRWSDELYRLYGFEPGEVVPTVAIWRDMLHPDDRAVIDAASARSLATGEPYRQEVRVVRRDGTMRVLESRGRAFFDAAGRLTSVEGSAQDVTERHRAEAALRESEARFRTVVEATTDVVWEWDLRTDAVWWSGRLREAFGYGEAQVEPSYAWWARCVHPDDLPRVTASLRTMVDGVERRWRHEYRLRRADGSYAQVVDRGWVVVDADGARTRMIGSIRDVTERRQLEEQVRQVQKMEAVGRLAGGVAHDFNNLLTAILGTAELALGALEPGHPVREDLEEIRRAGERAAALTRQLLAFGRRQAATPEPLDASEVVRGAEPLLRRLLGAEVRLATQLAGDACCVQADRGQLEQVLVNLVVNARDAMPRGGTVTLAVRRAASPPGHAGDGGWIALEVRDEGTGMDEATRTRIFEPFFTTKPVGQGTGLGLATVYAIVQQAGGLIVVRSEPGAGSVFELFLPEASGPAEAPGGDAPAAGPSLPPPATILLVEDEPAVRLAARRLLERAGYAVLEACDGHEALRLHEDLGDRVDLVLSDVVMPRLGGHELRERLRRRAPRCPVLLMSGFTDRPDADGAPTLAKPFTRDALLHAVRAALDATARG